MGLNCVPTTLMQAEYAGKMSVKAYTMFFRQKINARLHEETESNFCFLSK